MNDQLNQSNYQHTFYPPPPPVFDGEQVIESPHKAPFAKPRCNICDSELGVTLRSVKKDYVPSIAYVMLVLSLLIGLIVILATRVRHKLEIPFCDDCWKRTRVASYFETFALLGFVASIIVGLVLAVNLDNGFWVTGLGLLGLATLIWSQVYKRKNTPKYKTVDRKQVIVVTAAGELIFSK